MFLLISDISVLLFRRQRFVKRLKFKGLHDIVTVSEPQEHLVTCFNALSSKTYPMIKISQLIYPFFPIIMFFEFFENSDSLFKTYFLSFVEFIL